MIANERETENGRKERFAKGPWLVLGATLFLTLAASSANPALELHWSNHQKAYQELLPEKDAEAFEIGEKTLDLPQLTEDTVPGGLMPGQAFSVSSSAGADPHVSTIGTTSTLVSSLESINIEQGCLTAGCHAPIVAEQFIHPPTEQQQCTVCHTIIDKTKHEFELSAQPPELCYNCHGIPDKAKHIHGPVAQGACTACHDPHSSPNKFMLAEAGNQQCFICHTQMADHVNQASVQHGAVEKFGCVQCHDPHRGDEEFRLRSPLPTLCLQCHPQIRDTIEHATTQHGALSIEKKCVNCHNPHGSNEPKILKDKQINLCLGCHNKTMETSNGTIINMAAWIEKNPVRHGPINDGNCAACHNPHGSPNFRMLREPFPQKFYSEFDIGNYGLCFSCHEETLVLDQETSTLTGFRNGEKNLHFLHVNREKGRTCRACHEIHAGTKPKRIKDMVPFGNWAFPLNYEKNEEGGSCAPGCHVKRRYNRVKAIIQD